MYRQLFLFQLLKSEFKRQERLLNELRLRLRQLPSGHLACHKGNFYRVIHHQGTRDQILIPEKYPSRDLLIHDLKEKRYVSKAIPILENNLKHYAKILQHIRLYDPCGMQSELPAHYGDFDLTGLLLKGDIDPQKWVESPYTKNTSFPENLKYKSEGGLSTRSKAEADIATMLERQHLIFRYDSVITLGRHKLSPDFRIVHPVHRRLICWEHFGKMDDPQYAQDAMNKLQIYSEHGCFLGDGLVMTWETKRHPLHFGHIKNCIDKYFS